METEHYDCHMCHMTLTHSYCLIIHVTGMHVIHLFSLTQRFIITNSKHCLLCREYWVRYGVVTGGQYDSHSGCMPYQLPHCDHHEAGPYPNCTGETRTPECHRTCEDGQWNSL